MIQIKSKSEKRLIVEGTVNGKTANFLIDTGATVALVDDTKVKEYGLNVGKRFNGNLVGAGGTMNNVRYCNTFLEIEDKKISQFLIADISEVVKSVKRETGYEILGIISLPQMKLIGMNIDANDSLIIIE